MNLFRHFQDQIKALLAVIPALEEADLDRFMVELPRDPQHGDLACNVAMVYAKAAKMSPRMLAEQLIPGIAALEGVAMVSIAGPGFINMRLSRHFWQQGLIMMLNQSPQDLGVCDWGQGQKINVEYVSANPTGPLHLGHLRGLVIGDVMANLLTKSGWDVFREFYVNDAGNQVDILARSCYLRYREAFGEAVQIPEGFYPGLYLKEVGEALKARDGDKWLKADEAHWFPVVRRFAIEVLRKDIKAVLSRMGVHQHYSSEAALVEKGRVEEAMSYLDKIGLVYRGVLEPPKGQTSDDWEAREQLLFRSTHFGDDTDRPLQKSDGSWTYFANDVAYHFDKFQRGFTQMVDVLGEDHKGYVKRIQASVLGMTQNRGVLNVITCGIVKLSQDGEPVKMSKRAGSFITLDEIIDALNPEHSSEFGPAVLRFMMLTRKNDAPIELDMNVLKQQSKDNPVFYVNYAYARIRSTLDKVEEIMGKDFVARLEGHVFTLQDLAPLGSDAEVVLMRHIMLWPSTVESAARAFEPHRIAFYLSEFAATFHALWSAGKGDEQMRFLLNADQHTSLARIALLKVSAKILISGFEVLGIQALEEM